jgi:serine/threonine protein kinase
MPRKDSQQDSTEPSATITSPTADARSELRSDPTAQTVFEENPPQPDTKVLPPPQGLIGMTLDGRYAVEKELGHGGVGAVYLAHDKKLMNRPVVVKVLLEKSLQNEWAVQKFHQEKEALARVDHPGIVGVLDNGELPDGKPYIVMQFVEGTTLRSVIKPEGMDLDMAGRLMEQTGAALSAAHEEGIYHRDLKPDNIMIQKLAGGREQVKIIDFGIAKVRDSQLAPSTVTGQTAGTIAYMSPEQLRAEKVTQASDIYALGIIAYEMVTGRRPFNPESMFQLLEMQKEGIRVKPKDLRPALPETAQEVILKALEYEPRNRYQSAREFGEDFARAISRGAETPKGYVDREAPTKVIEPEQKEGKKGINPLLIGGIAILLLGIVGIGIWLALSSSKDSQPQQSSNTSTGPAAAERSLNYWLTVQKMRSGKPYQEPFESSGQEIFENGWKFRFNAASQQTGYLYLLNEGPDSRGGTSYNLLYPTPSANNGSAQLSASQQMQTGWYLFDENQGTEKFWIVWSEQAVKELEAVKGVVNPQDKGTIKDKAQSDAIRDLLTKNNSTKPEIVKDTAKKQTNVKGKGVILVNLVELEHH